jgi:hypothetical protein
MTTPSPGKAGIRHPIFARRCARLSQEMEQHGVAEHRRRLLAGELRFSSPTSPHVLGVARRPR